MIDQSRPSFNQNAKDPASVDPRAEIGAVARRTMAHMIKSRARAYSQRPMSLETLHPGLSSASATALIAMASHLSDRACRTRSRWIGFGGEIGLINARAALLLGRAMRRSLKMTDSPYEWRHGSPPVDRNQITTLPL